VIETLRALLSDLLVIFLVLVGVFFMLLSTFGLVRMPDTYARLHAAGKAGTLGIICILLAVGVHLSTFEAVLRVLALVVLFYITAPVAAHMIGRVVWRAGGHPECD
jgi:multicomponent Na+:H+ antiporter subunit G